MYKFEYDEKKDILEQIDRETLSFITYLFLTYVASEEEKKKFKEILINNEVEYKKNNL